VAMIVWECGYAFADGPERDAMRDMVESLSALGFRHLLPSQGYGVDAFRQFDAGGKYLPKIL
jgi:hypothetical protein